MSDDSLNLSIYETTQSAEAWKAFLRFCWDSLWARDRARLLANAPKTVWLFGAGASNHYNLNSYGVPIPLANGFFAAFNSLPTSMGFNAHVGPLVSYLAHYRNVAPNSISEWTENIETFMTSMERDLMTLSRKTKRSQAEILKGLSLATAMTNMTFIMGNVINEAQNGPVDSLYVELLKFCSPNDTFMTFNWDTLLDRALVSSGGWSPNDGYGIEFSATLDGTWKKRVAGAPHFKTKWKLLKLHGSTNWLVPYAGYNPTTWQFQRTVPKSESLFLYWQTTLPFPTHQGRWWGGYQPTCYGYYPPNIPGKQFTSDQLSAGPGQLFVKTNFRGVFSPFKEPNIRGVPSSPLLITPVKQKRYEDYDAPLQLLWEQAAQQVRGAERVIIVGYSFPKTDTRAIGLLTDALAARKGQIDIEVVAPDADQITRRIGSRNLRQARSVRLHPVRFEEYLRVLRLEWAPYSMLRAAEDEVEVREWLERLAQMQQFPFELHPK